MFTKNSKDIERAKYSHKYALNCVKKKDMGAQKKSKRKYMKILLMFLG